MRIHCSSKDTQRAYADRDYFDGADYSAPSIQARNNERSQGNPCMDTLNVPYTLHAIETFRRQRRRKGNRDLCQSVWRSLAIDEESRERVSTSDSYQVHRSDKRVRNPSYIYRPAKAPGINGSSAAKHEKSIILLQHYRGLLSAGNYNRPIREAGEIYTYIHMCSSSGCLCAWEYRVRVRRDEKRPRAIIRRE